MHTLISGGCKNGKSYYAQRVAKAAGQPLYYLATMISTGAEDDARIARHLQAEGVRLEFLLDEGDARLDSGAAYGAPETAIVSVGYNSYGHPDPDTLARFAAANMTVLRTDQLGNITIPTDEKERKNG